MGDLVHLGIIMDGNGRWATGKGLPRSFGHKEGAKAAKRVVDALLAEGSVRYLTLFCFSTENWKRPLTEISFLMGLLNEQIESCLNEYKDKGVRLLHLGRKDRLPLPVLRILSKAEAETKDNTRLTVQLAIDYGGEDELERAIKKALSKGETDFSAGNLLRFTDNPSVPPPDMIVRSGGERRLSGFLMLASSYSEINFYDRLWPDWDESMVKLMLGDFHSRHRRFGGL